MSVTSYNSPKPQNAWYLQERGIHRNTTAIYGCISLDIICFLDGELAIKRMGRALRNFFTQVSTHLLLFIGMIVPTGTIIVLASLGLVKAYPKPPTTTRTTT